MWDVWVLLLLVAVLAVLVAPRFIRMGPRGGTEQGTLLVTGVSPRPDDPGEQYVTVVGVLHGPTVSEREVYQRIALDTADWPTVGDLLPVVYSPANPDNFAFTGPGGQGR
ncbi:MAG TPA: hypothetical protein VF299_11610 [Mycobacterium sp.]